MKKIFNWAFNHLQAIIIGLIIAIGGTVVGGIILHNMYSGSKTSKEPSTIVDVKVGADSKDSPNYLAEVPKSDTSVLSMVAPSTAHESVSLAKKEAPKEMKNIEPSQEISHFSQMDQVPKKSKSSYDLFKPSIGIVGKKGNQLTMSLKIKNISGREIYLAFDTRKGPIAVIGNKGTACYSNINFSTVTGLPQIGRFYINDKQNYSRVGIDEVVVVVFEFTSKDYVVIEDTTFELSSNVVLYNDGDIMSLPLSVSDIRL